MSKPWPDEVRQMVDALMHGGACPSVYGCSDGGHRIHTGRAWADYDTAGNWLFRDARVSGAVALAELLQRSDTVAPAQSLSNRILVAVPTARTVTTDDGIEVSVGSKSVRWKRERNGWSLGDDLFTSDERVIEHAKAMAADEAALPAPPQPSPRAQSLLDAAAAMTAASRGILDQVQQAHAAKGTTMTTQTKTTTQRLIQTAAADAGEAAWRTAGSQFVKLAREPLVGLLTRHLAPNDDAFRARLAAFLETELGTALLASMLSATLSAMPQTTGEVPQKLARELRVKAMADAGDVMADVLMGPLREVMRLYLQDPAGATAAPALPEADRSAASVDWSKAREVAR